MQRPHVKSHSPSAGAASSSLQNPNNKKYWQSVRVSVHGIGALGKGGGKGGEGGDGGEGGEGGSGGGNEGGGGVGDGGFAGGGAHGGVDGGGVTGAGEEGGGHTQCAGYWHEKSHQPAYIELFSPQPSCAISILQSKGASSWHTYSLNSLARAAAASSSSSRGGGVGSGSEARMALSPLPAVPPLTVVSA